MAELAVTAERGALVSITGRVDSSAVTLLRAHVTAALTDPDLDYLAVDLSGATRSDPTLFTVLAETEARLRDRTARLVVIGLHHEVLASLDEANMWAVFTLFQVARRGHRRPHPIDEVTATTQPILATNGSRSGELVAPLLG